jgi:arylsulfatase
MGWAQVSNTPFPSYKTYTGGGGRRVSFIVSWPEKLKDFGATRSQFGHVIDVMPTLLDLAGVPALETSHGEPAQPMQGQSLAQVLRNADAPAPRIEQYYECWANRAYYRDGWVAVSLQKRGEVIDFDNWTLHAHAEDFSESMDLRRQHPQKLAELVTASARLPGRIWSIRSTIARRRRNFWRYRRTSAPRSIAVGDFSPMGKPCTAV